MDVLYPGIDECRALIVDGNHTSRSILAAQLRDMGVGTVVQKQPTTRCARQAGTRNPTSFCATTTSNTASTAARTCLTTCVENNCCPTSPRL